MSIAGALTSHLSSLDEAKYPRPFDRSSPVFWIKLRKKGGGQERLNISERVKYFEISDGASSRKKIMDQLTLHVTDFDFSEYDDPLWDHGNVLEVCWGYQGVMARPRRYMIKAVEVQKDELRILGQGGVALNKQGLPIGLPFMDGVKGFRFFKGKKISYVVKEVCIANGFSEDMLDIQETETVFDHLQQPGISDARWLKQLRNRLHDWIMYVDPGGTFHFHEPRYDQAPIRSIHWYVDRYRGDLFSISFEQQAHRRAGKITTAHHDPMKRGGDKKNEGTKTDHGSNKTVKRVGTAPSTLATSEEEAKQDITINGNLATEQAASIVREEAKVVVGPDKKEKTKGMYRASQRGASVLRLTLVGDPSLEAKKMVDLHGVGKKLSGRYYIKHVVHKIEPGSGYGTVITLARDGHGGKGVKSEAKQNKKAAQEGQLDEVILDTSSPAEQAGFRHERPDRPTNREPGERSDRRVRWQPTGGGASPHRIQSGDFRGVAKR